MAKVDGKWTLESPGFTNLLAGTGLVSSVPPFGGTGDFDLSAHGICFVARDPELNPARYTTAPVFSRDGKQIAFARMKDHQYESDKARLLLLPDVDDVSNVQEFYKTDDGEGGWDRRVD